MATTVLDYSNPVFSVLATIADFFYSLAAAQSRSTEIRALNQLSDAELSDIGLRRDEIAKHVFRD